MHFEFALQLPGKDLWNIDTLVRFVRYIYSR